MHGTLVGVEKERRRNLVLDLERFRVKCGYLKVMAQLVIVFPTVYC